MIDWKTVQARLVARGYPAGAADGRPGPKTYAALFGYAAGRQPDKVVIGAIGASAADHLPDYEIDATPARLAEFIAQTCNETGGFRMFEEQLSYSAEAIRKTWPSRFPTATSAAAVARNPEALANRVYDRASMGNDKPGDGWRYRGRGMLQLTFKANYRRFGDLLKLPLVDQPDLAADPCNSLVIAAEFWRAGKVNAAVDRGDFREARRITNGGAIGLEHVAALRGRLFEVLA